MSGFADLSFAHLHSLSPRLSSCLCRNMRLMSALDGTHQAHEWRTSLAVICSQTASAMKSNGPSEIGCLHDSNLALSMPGAVSHIPARRLSGFISRFCQSHCCTEILIKPDASLQPVLMQSYPVAQRTTSRLPTFVLHIVWTHHKTCIPCASHERSLLSADTCWQPHWLLSCLASSSILCTNIWAAA